MINIALDALKQNHFIPSQISKDDVRPIINKIDRRILWIVFDIFHDDFDATRAHLYGQDLPVTIVTMRRSKKKVAEIFKTNASQDRKVNFDIRFLFNRYGASLHLTKTLARVLPGRSPLHLSVTPGNTMLSSEMRLKQGRVKENGGRRVQTEVEFAKSVFPIRLQG